MQIYFGNMSYGTTEETLRDLFSQYGEVDSIKIIYFCVLGYGLGFGFVTMNDDAAAQKAIDELNGKEVDGRALRINEARPKEERPRRNFDNRF